MSLFHSWIHLLCLLFHMDFVSHGTGCPALENCGQRFLPFTFDPSQSYQFDFDQSTSLRDTQKLFYLQDKSIWGPSPSKWDQCTRRRSFWRAILSSCLDWQISCDQPFFLCTVRPDYLLQYQNELGTTTDKVALSMPYFQWRFPRSSTTSTRNGLFGAEILAFLRYILLPARTQVRGRADRSTRNVTKAHANCFGSMQTYWLGTWNYGGCWTTAGLAEPCSERWWHVWKLNKCSHIYLQWVGYLLRLTLTGSSEHSV